MEVGSEGASGTDRRRVPTWFWVLLGLIALGGVALRVGYIANARWDEPISGDALYYHEAANLIADGHGYAHPLRQQLYGVIEPGADHPPLYPAYLAIFSAVGLRTGNEHLLASAFLGGATIWLAGLIGLRLGRRERGPRLGLLAAALTATNPLMWRHDGSLLSESMALATTALVLWLAYRYLDRPTNRALFVIGLSVGIATLARSELLLYLPLVVLPVVLLRGDRTWRGRAARVGLAIGGCALLVVPWVVRNWIQVGRPVLSTQFEVTLATANCQTSYYDPAFVGSWDFTCGGDALKEAGVADIRDPRFDETLGREARRFIGANAGSVPRVVFRRLERGVTAYDTAHQVHLDRDEGSPELVTNLGFWAFRLVLVGSIAGGVVLWRRRVPISPLIGVIATAFLTIAVLYFSTRFRAPGDLAMTILSAVAIDALLPSPKPNGRAADDPAVDAPAGTVSGAH